MTLQHATASDNHNRRIRLRRSASVHSVSSRSRFPLLARVSLLREAASGRFCRYYISPLESINQFITRLREDLFFTSLPPSPCCREWLVRSTIIGSGESCLSEQGAMTSGVGHKWPVRLYNFVYVNRILADTGTHHSRPQRTSPAQKFAANTSTLRMLPALIFSGTALAHIVLHLQILDLDGRG